MNMKLLGVLVVILCMASKCSNKEELMPENIRLYGIVMDKESLLPITDALVELKGSQGTMAWYDVAKTKSDSLGYFEINFSPQQQDHGYVLRFEKAGYIPVSKDISTDSIEQRFTIFLIQVPDSTK